MPKPLNKATFDRVVVMLKNGPFTFREIGDCCGVNAETVSRIARGKHFHQADDAEQARRLNKPSATKRSEPRYIPAPDEIAKACDRIQATKLVSCDVDDDDLKAGWMPPVYSERSMLGVSKRRRPSLHEKTTVD